MTDTSYPIEDVRQQVTKTTPDEVKAKYGQFLTQKAIADFMVSLLGELTEGCEFLDAGAGIGSLTNAFYC